MALAVGVSGRFGGGSPNSGLPNVGEPLVTPSHCYFPLCLKVKGSGRREVLAVNEDPGHRVATSNWAPRGRAFWHTRHLGHLEGSLLPPQGRPGGPTPPSHSASNEVQLKRSGSISASGLQRQSQGKIFSTRNLRESSTVWTSPARRDRRGLGRAASKADKTALARVFVCLPCLSSEPWVLSQQPEGGGAC